MILCVIDGMNHRGFSLDLLPHLAEMAQRGAWGSFCTVPQGFLPETLCCNASLLGLAAGQIPQHARAWLEARGEKIPFTDQDLLLRATRVAVKGGKTALLRQKGAQAGPLPAGVSAYAVDGCNTLLVAEKQRGLLEKIICYPPHAHIGEPVEAMMPEGSGLLRQIAWPQEGEALIPWAPSAAQELAPRFENGAAICGVALVRGLAAALGLECPMVCGATGKTDTDLPAKTQAALEWSRKTEFVFLHFNGADEAAHELDIQAKMAFLNKLDEQVLPRLSESGQPLLICCDHGSEPSDGSHSGGAQPFVLWNTPYRGNLGILEAAQALPLLKGAWKNG